jgi:hypothetical protein
MMRFAANQQHGDEWGGGELSREIVHLFMREDKLQVQMYLKLLMVLMSWDAYLRPLGTSNFIDLNPLK